LGKRIKKRKEIRMRVTAGTLKNRKIKSREGRETRPTLERIKEAIFSIIGDKIVDAKFLDLYSGTGNIAIEALSRGAKRAVMIEQDKEALRIIIDNIDTLGLTNVSRAYKNDVSRAIEILGRKNEKFDIIFLDPPYKENISISTIEKVSENNILAEGGIIISEHSTYEKMPEKIGNFVKYDERNYNKKIVTFYCYE
jgi:hypothetical protein